MSPYILIGGSVAILLVAMVVVLGIAGKQEDKSRDKQFKDMHPVKREGFNGEDDIIIWEKKDKIS
jgi:hypothetical protein